MRYPRFVFFLCVMFLMLLTGSVCLADQAQWKVVVPQKVFAEKLRVAAFLNENFGINGGAGDIGKARFTMDGGKSWIQAESSGG